MTHDMKDETVGEEHHSPEASLLTTLARGAIKNDVAESVTARREGKLSHKYAGTRGR